MIENFNTFMSLILSAITGWAVMSHRVRDGVTVKAGLIWVSIGFLCAALVSIDGGDHNSLATAYALVFVGLLICAVGYLLRTHRSRRKGTMRRVSDWVEPI